MSGRKKRASEAITKGKLCRWCRRPTGNVNRTCRALKCKMKTMMMDERSIDTVGIEVSEVRLLK